MAAIHGTNQLANNVIHPPPSSPIPCSFSTIDFPPLLSESHQRCNKTKMKGDHKLSNQNTGLGFKNDIPKDTQKTFVQDNETETRCREPDIKQVNHELVPCCISFATGVCVRIASFQTLFNCKCCTYALRA